MFLHVFDPASTITLTMLELTPEGRAQRLDGTPVPTTSSTTGTTLDLSGLVSPGRPLDGPLVIAVTGPRGRQRTLG